MAKAVSTKVAVTAEVPVAAVVLYSSGVGYFEHTGHVTGKTTTELRFKAAQINDVLKSLVLQDLGGGKVGSVIYPSHDPVARALKSFQVDLTANPGLAALLNQLRGAVVSVKMSTETITGTILGLEQRPQATELAPIDVWVLNLLTEGTIRAMPLEEVGGITLQDPQLQEELVRALGVVAQARDQDKKPVTIEFAGEGERAVRIGYVVETPIWKTSYRLILPTEGTKDAAHLQGWAIIENQTDNDWPSVELTLVSGRPISFIQELYQPMYVQRPTVQPELYASLRPQMYEGGVTEAIEPMMAMMMEAAPAGGGGGGVLAKRKRSASGMGQLEMEEQRILERKIDPTQSVSAAAAGAKLGELFEYTVGNVTLPRQRSAMIPIVTDPIEIERLSIYNESVLAKHPLYGVKLTNTTGKHLLQGPVTVLEESAYAGDARIDNLPPKQHRYLSYGIDLQLVASTTRDDDQGQIMTVSIAKGVLHIHEKYVKRVEHAFENKGEKKKTVMVEHPIEPRMKLVDTAALIETTDTHYRFQFAAPPGEKTVFAVVTQMIREDRRAITAVDVSYLEVICKNAATGKGVVKAIEDLLERRRKIYEIESQIKTIETQLKELTAEQERIRENIKTTPKGSQYQDRLLGKLNEQETMFEQLQKDLDALRQKRDAGNKKLADEVAGWTVKE